MAIQGAPSDDPDRGRRVGKYQILTRLSVGGMAELFLAFTSGPGGFRKYIALKQILPDVKTEEFVKMFLDEARITAAFSHANIGQVFDLGREDGELYLAMEFIAGQNLEQLMKAADKNDAPLPPGFAARVIRDVALALHYAHHFVDPTGRAVSVVHRDMSPRNVMVTYDGGVKVIDFGIAKAKGRLGRTAVGMVKGTGGYMSPEQVRGHELDGRSDLFTAGVLLHEMLCGQRLFNAPGDTAMMLQIVEGEIPSPSLINPAVPPALEAVVMKALSRDKAKRFATGRELAKAIEAAMGPELFDEEGMAGLMAEYFTDKIQKTRALLEYANRDDARLSEAAGALQDDPGDTAPTAQVRRTPKPRSAPGQAPRSRKPAGGPAQTAVVSTPRGGRHRVAARQEPALETQEDIELDPEDFPATQPRKGLRPGARASASAGTRRVNRSATPTETPADTGEEGGSRWAGRLFLLAFFAAMGGLLYFEPVRAAVRPTYEAAVAWVKTELDLNPPPPPPDTQSWPEQRPRPPNPLASDEKPAPPGPEPAPAVAEAAPESPPPAEPEKTDEAIARVGQGTAKPGTSRPRGQGSTSPAKGEPGRKPGASGDTGTAARSPRNLQEELAAEPNTTVEQNPDGEAEVLDTKDPRKMRKAGIGLLTLYTIPRAAVFDGQTSLGTTPLLKVPLQAGTYRLRIVDSEGNSRLFSAPVELAREKKYTIKVSDLPLYKE